MKLIRDEFTYEPMSDQLKAYYRKIISGLCVNCGRKNDGTTRRCKRCTRKRSRQRRGL